jgi:Head domain of trimeric autotransporter adhesin
MKKYLLLVFIITTKICVAQNVGIGTLTPTNKLQVIGAVSADTLLLGNGANVPILQFKSSATGRKISLWPPTANDDHVFDGFGLEPQFMRYQIYSTTVDHAFFAGTSSTTSNELMRIKGNGNVGIGTTAPVARLHIADSNVLFSGPTSLPASTMFDPPASGAGVRMFWYPEKGAFRVGVVAGTEWNKSNIGNYSFATGSSNQANGNGSFSTGLANVSSGENSFTGGYFNTASGYSSLAFGQNNVASNDYALAMGFTNNATATHSVAIGTQNNATAFFSTALGYLNTASAYASTVLGQGNTAAGSYSLSAGRGTIAKAAGSTTLGYFNENSDNPNANVEANTDRIFQVGNGTFSARNNALTILRNGNVGIGPSSPATTLHVKSSTSNPVIIDGGNQLFVTLAENGINRGYIGSYAGNAEDVELGTYSGNTGSVHLTTQNIPRLTVKSNGNVGIGTSTPQAALDVAGYTVLGEQSAKIKMKKSSFFTNAFDGGISNIALGFGSEKVLEVSIMIEAASGVFYPLNYTAQAGYQVQYKLEGNAIQLRNIAGNCSNVLGKPIKINVTYEE